MGPQEQPARQSARGKRRPLIAIVGAAAALALGATAVWWALQPEPPRAPTPEASARPSVTPSPSPEPPPAPVFDRAARSIDDPDSIWLVSNKLRPITPLDHAPADILQANVPGSAPMRAEAAAAMEQLFAAASAEAGLGLVVQNAYRSYATQVGLHERLVQQLGRDRARAQSAMPGYSEHQTGLTADIMAANGVCTIQECFAATPEGAWLAENAWRFGFHLRYPQGKTDVTGYIFEPWHYRYVGTELAAELRATGTLTLEEFFGLPPAPDYPPGV